MTSIPIPFVPKRGEGAEARRASSPISSSGRLALIFATACATCATASFMAYHFHDLSPYVLIGNPLTLTVIEFFAVPGALLGAALYPLGLDAPVWLYVGARASNSFCGRRDSSPRPRIDPAFARVRALCAAVPCACGA